jgi:hypothetical protein
MDTLAPICELIQQTLMAQLVDTEPAWDGNFVEADLDAVLKGNIEQRSQSYQRFLQSGVYTPNELRKFENEKPINDPAADAIYLPVNMEPVSPEMRKLVEKEAEQQAEENQLRFEQQQELAVAGAVNGNGNGAPRPNPNPPAPKPAPKLERRLAEIEDRLTTGGL